MAGQRFQDAAVEAVFDAYPAGVRERLLALRALILATAAATPGVGPLAESLKWGQPAYRPRRSGTTVRIDADGAEGFALFVPCTTSLLDDWRGLWPDALRWDGDRAVRFRVGEAVDEAVLARCVAMALTYRRRKAGRQGKAA